MLTGNHSKSLPEIIQNPYRKSTIRPGICQIRTASDPTLLPQIPLYKAGIPVCTPRQQPRIRGCCRMKKFVSTTASDLSFGAMRACVRREGSRCEKTEEDTEQPIAAPACPSYGTRLSLRDLCVLRAVRAVGSGFRRGAVHSARAGASWVGFSGLETPRDHATDDMPSPIA